MGVCFRLGSQGMPLWESDIKDFNEVREWSGEATGEEFSR